MSGWLSLERRLVCGCFNHHIRMFDLQLAVKFEECGDIRIKNIVRDSLQGMIFLIFPFYPPPPTPRLTPEN